MNHTSLAERQEYRNPGIHHVAVRMPSPVMDAWASLRRWILRRSFQAVILNGSHRNFAGGVPGDLNQAKLQVADEQAGSGTASEIRRYITMLKANWMDERTGKVDYGGLRASEAYEVYRQRCTVPLQSFSPQELASLEARKAFWINLYNALVVDAVISFDVQHTVTEGWLGILAFFQKAAYRVEGRTVRLDDIEHGILRGNRGHPFLPGTHFNSRDPRLAWAVPADPRVHFALNCASQSCPPIQFYSPEHLDAQLDLAARNFIDQTVEVDKGVVRLSKIFHWYRGDFGGREGVLAFLRAYLPEDQRRETLADQQDSIRFAYQPYDWGLNTIPM